MTTVTAVQWDLFDEMVLNIWGEGGVITPAVLRGNASNLTAALLGPDCQPCWPRFSDFADKAMFFLQGAYPEYVNRVTTSNVALPLYRNSLSDDELLAVDAVAISIFDPSLVDLYFRSPTDFANRGFLVHTWADQGYFPNVDVPSASEIFARYFHLIDQDRSGTISLGDEMLQFVSMLLQDLEQEHSRTNEAPLYNAMWAEDYMRAWPLNQMVIGCPTSLNFSSLGSVTFRDMIVDYNSFECLVMNSSTLAMLFVSPTFFAEKPATDARANVALASGAHLISTFHPLAVSDAFYLDIPNGYKCNPITSADIPCSDNILFPGFRLTTSNIIALACAGVAVTCLLLCSRAWNLWIFEKESTIAGLVGIKDLVDPEPSQNRFDDRISQDENEEDDELEMQQPSRRRTVISDLAPTLPLPLSTFLSGDEDGQDDRDLSTTPRQNINGSTGSSRANSSSGEYNLHEVGNFSGGRGVWSANRNQEHEREIGQTESVSNGAGRQNETLPIAGVRPLPASGWM
jgi:hypothetical protein